MLAATDANASRRSRGRSQCSAEVRTCRNNNDPLYCMTCNAVYEARNQGFEGMVYVNQTVLTRAKMPTFYPSNICAIIFQRSQFSWTHERRRCISDESWASAKRSAQEALNRGPNGKANYHADYASPKWARNCIGRRVMGDHIFYGFCSTSKNLAHFKREILPQFAATENKRTPRVQMATLIEAQTSRPDLPNKVSR